MSKSNILEIQEMPQIAINETGYLGTHVLTLTAAIWAKQRGLSSKEFFNQQIRQIIELDIDQLEFHFEAEMLYPGIVKTAVEQLPLYFPDTIFSLHLPFRYLDVSCPIERIRLASVESILDAVKSASALEPIHCVIHLTGNVFSSYKCGLDPLIGEGMTHVEQSLKEITTLVKPENILVENLTQVDFHYFMPVVEKMGLSICQDIGHIVLQGGDYLQFSRDYAPLIKQIHLHDVNVSRVVDSVRVFNDHKAIGTGILDFDELFTNLGEVGYKGSIVLEIDERQLIPESINYVRELTRSHLDWN